MISKEYTKSLQKLLKKVIDGICLTMFVYHPKKPGKKRIVFGLSAEDYYVSINKEFLPETDFSNQVVGVLLHHVSPGGSSRATKNLPKIYLEERQQFK